MNQEAAERAMRELIDANGVVDGRARITLLRGAAGAWSFEGGPDSEMLFFTSSEPFPKPSEVAITISPYRVLSHGPLAGVKKTAMIENVLALEEARSRGFSEAVMVNERGEIVGATAANIFWAEGDELFTPSLATGCIPGITRSIVVEIAGKIGLYVVEGSFPVQRLLDAREGFLTSTTRGLAPIASFDVKRYGPNESRAIERISREFQKAAREC
jgi:branched-chain amino acid aminotransferase